MAEERNRRWLERNFNLDEDDALRPATGCLIAGVTSFITVIIVVLILRALL